MTEKMFKDVLPCGILTTRSGKEYWLLKPEPVVKDSWQHDQQQRWLVVPNEELSYTSDQRKALGIESKWAYSYMRHLVTTNPDIEYRYEQLPIKVLDLDEWDTVNEAEPANKSDVSIPADVAETMKEFQYE